MEPFALVYMLCWQNLRIVGRVLMIFPGNFGKMFRPGACNRRNTNSLAIIIFHNMQVIGNCNNSYVSSDSSSWLTIFLHVFSSSIAKHLRCSWSCDHSVSIDHHFHVFVHWVGPVHVLESTRFKVLINGAIFCHIALYVCIIQKPQKFKIY